MLSVLFDPAGKPLLALDLIIGRGTAVYMMVSVRENFLFPLLADMGVLQRWQVVNVACTKKGKYRGQEKTEHV